MFRLESCLYIGSRPLAQGPPAQDPRQEAKRPEVKKPRVELVLILSALPVCATFLGSARTPVSSPHRPVQVILQVHLEPSQELRLCCTHKPLDRASAYHSSQVYRRHCIAL